MNRGRWSSQLGAERIGGAPLPQLDSDAALTAPAPASGSDPNRALVFGRSGAALLSFAHFCFLRSCYGMLADVFAE